MKAKAKKAKKALWYAINLGSGVGIFDEARPDMVALVCGPSMTRTMKEVEADARLLLASQDMLEALRGRLNGGPLWGLSSREYEDRIEAVIKSATG